MARLRVGLVLDMAFHREKRWTSVCSPRLVEGLMTRFDCRVIQSQADYEKSLADLEAIFSMEPGCGAPLIEFGRTPALLEKFSAIPSYVLNSDPHDKAWGQSYFLGNGMDFFATFYYHPTLYHMRRLRPEQLVFFPWAVPDELIPSDPIRLRGQDRIFCFGAEQDEAYAAPHWCRAFPFVETAGSSVEDAAVTDEGYMRWLAGKDAAIAAGSDDPRYRLTVPKYFEIVAAGALLFAQETDDLALLGFRHMENCVIFNRSNFERLAREYLADPEGYLAIREAGRQLIRARHSLSVRLDALERHMRDAIEHKRRISARGRARVVSPARASGAIVSQSRLARPSDTRRPHVLFIVDAPNWAHDFKTQNLARCLGADYDIRKLYQNEVTENDLDQADLVLVYYWLQFAAMSHLSAALERNRHKLLVGVCSWLELEGERREPGLRTIRSLARAVFVNNMRQYLELRGLLDLPVFYTPNGVDTEFFTPGPARSGGCLRVGWAGSLSNHGNVRGYHDFIVPAVQSVPGVELVTAAREEKWRGQEEMREFYRSLDVYICASRKEGTPNPCLEAAACGLPLLTTRVGNMPELVVHGVNGMFIERDVEDIAAKLRLLLHNPDLRRQMGRVMLQTIRQWDWRHQAENYRVMFDSVLSDRASVAPAAGGAAPSFTASSELYLASADRMDCVLRNLDSLRSAQPPKVRTFATVIGGLSGLNYLLHLRPRRIVFYDRNLAAIEYGRMILEMIEIADGPRDFISRMFGRSVEAFLAETGAEDLTVANQDRYLAAPVSGPLVEDTLWRLSAESREVYRKFVVPHHAGKVLDGVRNCRRLLPCWPANERVPVGAGEALGTDEAGNLVPNTNAFFYGLGWLGSREAFARVQQALRTVHVRFAPFDLLKQDLRCLADLSGTTVLHVSNIDEWFPQEWSRCVKEWESQVLAAGGCLTVITARNGLRSLRADPHVRALMAVAPFAFGRVVEVTHKTPWGFHELSPQNVAIDDYLASDFPADTTILHILVGEGVPREKFLAAYRKALTASRRVIVLEHNRDSRDWSDEQRQSLFSQEDLRALLEEAAGETPIHLTRFLTIRGESDRARNMLAVVDTVAPSADVPPEAVEEIEAGAEAIQREDWETALACHVRAMALAPDLPELAQTVERLKVLQATARRTRRSCGGRSRPISFCIITNGARPEKLRLAIRSIRRLNVPDCEIIVVGKRCNEPGVISLPAEEAAAAGRLGAMRNLAVRHARHENIAILDDDILLSPSWYEGFLSLGEDFDIVTSRILLPDGTRYWDYVTYGGPRGHILLRDYEPPDDFVYMSGGCAWVMSERVARTVQWEEHLGFYQEEDVRFSRACVAKGFRIVHNPRSVAYHFAPEYTRVGRSVLKRSPGLDNLWLLARPELGSAEELMGLVQRQAAARRVAELADCLRAGIELCPDDPRFGSIWKEFEAQFGGDAGGDCWKVNGDPGLKRLLAELGREDASVTRAESCISAP